MLAAIERDRVVRRFVVAYANQHDRHGILGGAARERELAETIGREVVLAMIVEVRRVLPGFFGKQQRGKLKEEEKESIDGFLRELVAALGRAADWGGEDRRQFRRDLALYSDFGARQQIAVAKPRQGQKASPEEPPFVGRVALLLDPSMLDEARRAARRFHDEVVLLARKLFKQTVNPPRT